MIEGGHFERLHEIMRLLLRSPASAALAELFETLASSLPMASVVLIRESADGPRIDQFHPAGSPPSPAGLLQARGRYGWLAHYDERRQAELEAKPVQHHETLPRPRAAGTAQLILLPLVTLGQVFGALQIESSVQLDEADLRFFDAVTSALALALDREQARLRQDELLATARAAVHSRDQVLAMVTHDLGSMLTGILLQASIGLERGRAASFASISATAHRMKRLIRDLADQAALESGRLSVEKRPCVVATLLAQAVEESSAEARERQVQIDVQCGGLPPIEADSERLLQVLSNLLSNALQVTPAGGTIRVTAGLAGGAVRFSVTDGGPGIRSEDRERVFEHQWRAPGTAYRGRGLGLFIARGIVEAHGGRIWVESGPGSGATLLFGLPIPG